MGADHAVLVSQSGRAKDYEGQNLQEGLTRLLDLNDGSLVSVECCDMSDEEAAVESLLKVTMATAMTMAIAMATMLSGLLNFIVQY